MSQFQKHEPCFKCGSRDNLARYSDGHGYCFGCGYWEPGNEALEKPLERAVAPSDGTGVSNPLVPEDITLQPSERALEWISKYELDEEDLRNNLVGWSESKERLYFPLWGPDGVVTFYAARYLGNNPDEKKWLTFGKVDKEIDIFNSSKKSLEHGIILVEDIISAIKVGKLFPTSCLFGCTPNNHRLLKYKQITSSVIFWLDSNMHAQSVKLANRAIILGMNGKNILEDKDPKNFSLKEIERILIDYKLRT